MRYKAVMFPEIRLFGAASLLLALTAVPATSWSIPGDVRHVSSEFAILREHPSGASAVVARVAEGQAVLEIQRQGNWLNVGVLGAGVTGWIHLSFLEESRRTRPRSQPLIPPMRRFRPVFEAFNSMNLKNDATPFLSVAERERGVLVVSASPSWWSEPVAQRRDDVMSLHQMWKVANEGLPVTVIVRDPAGKRRLVASD